MREFLVINWRTLTQIVDGSTNMDIEFNQTKKKESVSTINQDIKRKNKIMIYSYTTVNLHY